jgi:hypothetical protein
MLTGLPILVLATALIILSGCTRSTRPAPEPAPSAAPSPARDTTAAPSPREGSSPWLAVDSTPQTATLRLQVTAPPGSPSALINGYRTGQARIVVPLGWTVRWNWRNDDPTSSHSLVVMVQREKIPLEGGRPSLTNAMTRMITAGLPPGATDQTSFLADEAGWYWLLCGVPNHALEGEWLELRVDPDAKAPGVVVKE